MPTELKASVTTCGSHGCLFEVGIPIEICREREYPYDFIIRRIPIWTFISTFAILLSG